MNIKIFICGLIILLGMSGFVFTDSVIVSQVDNSSLLVNQMIKVYVSVTDAAGNSVAGLKREQFKLYESVPGKEGEERPIIDFISGANVNDGINILFLLDNSGSMYTDMAGRETGNEDAQRITYAKQAINDLLRKIKNPADRLALLSFNIKTDTDISPTDDKSTIAKALTAISRPTGNEQYTELYESLYYSITKLRNVKGRKVIVLLSDGENFPYMGEKPPQFKDRKGLAAAIGLAQQEGISVYTIGIIEGASNPDLKRIADETGGVSYQAQDLQQLKDLYNRIRDRVLSEYLLTYTALMEPADRKIVTIQFLKSNVPFAQRSYYSATLFGKPQTTLALWIFAFILGALLLLFLLSKLRFEKKRSPASLEVLSVDGKKSRIQPITIMEDKRAVTISGSDSADLTITGDPKLAHTEVTLRKEGGEYTVISSGGAIKVNNQSVLSKKLRSGDLITVGSTTIVFDGGFDKSRLHGGTGIKPSRNAAAQKIARRTGKQQR